MTEPLRKKLIEISIRYNKLKGSFFKTDAEIYEKYLDEYIYKSRGYHTYPDSFDFFLDYKSSKSNK